MYSLQAVIVTESARGELLDSVQGARLVALGQHLSLLPLTEVPADAGVPGFGEFWTAPAGFDRLLAECSRRGAVAYVEAEYFGGTGTQSAQVWDSGETVFGPQHQAEGESGGSPISQALRWLGVVKGDHFDEFDAVGLGRHRDTDDWLLA
ncbi:hypothetical protein DL990_16690 [Amycolatopsis sp. WAC 01416]|uniref:hypothetical protein n=1 Tax=Amycolatopsis sp. WAC 01416 TaxID=2203196 RepID=UPI000F782816|nr:hypothetical protein [Amycolatopsis sp. WAC 01416]RSN33590.1 hypothetical protein DL990_16690 [Amycolatopsis sp. WAC 01416]